ncbi:helix-turn-helix domain-containing protein [Actinomadura citrea]|uniref:helix-turn-helix domain-containing protein n=1 Tax=Actinomadura citrea TaxID=46158 RepID=UPI003CE5B07C
MGAGRPRALTGLHAAGSADRPARPGGPDQSEVGARLFISPRTVEWHLRKTFGKLGITSRKQLQRSGATGER